MPVASPAPTGAVSANSTRLMAPKRSLASCVRAYIARDTTGLGLLRPEQRLNRYPATPFCSITWVIRGEVEMLDPPPERPAPVVPFFFAGPQSRPLVSYNPGPVEFFCAMFYPPALHQLAGIDMAASVDRFYTLPEVFGPAWLAMAQAVQRAPDDAARVGLLDQFLDPLWQAGRGGADQPGGVVGDWVRRLAVQAVGSSWGNGVRNAERRVKAWAGQPMRTLRRMQRAEQLFVQTRDEMGTGKVSWADVAARGGYADQAHFCREARDITGLSPAQLRRAILEDESYWIYRIWS